MATYFKSNLIDNTNTWDDLRSHPSNKIIKKTCIFLIFVFTILIIAKNYLGKENMTVSQKAVPVMVKETIINNKYCFYNELLKLGIINGKIKFINTAQICE